MSAHLAEAHWLYDRVFLWTFIDKESTKELQQLPLSFNVKLNLYNYGSNMYIKDFFAKKKQCVLEE